MILSKLLPVVVGLGAGILVSAGVFTVLLSVGLVPRFAGKTHTGEKIFLYEDMVVFGTLVGCLALAIAEMLDSIPILTRRIGFRHGLGLMVISIAMGKAVGSLLYFWHPIFR